MRGSPGLPTPAVATFGTHSMSSPPTTDARPSGAPQPSAAGAAPPHSIEAEQSVLGAMLLSDRTHYAFVIEEGLKVEDFYRERHREVYESMLALFTAGESIDVLTVTEHLRSRGRLDSAGGQAEIDALTAAVPAVGNLRQYAQIVRDRALLRRLLTASYEIQASVHGHEAPPRELVEWAERAVLEVAHDDRQKDFRLVGEVLHAEVRKWQELSAEGRSLTGTPSGFADLDSITGGFQPGNLIIIAARPSMGKSALVTNMAENVALNKDNRRPVALFSLEMSEAELAQRFIASQASIKGDDLRKGRLRDETKWKRVLRTAGEYDAAPLYVDDSSDIGIMDVRAKARRLHQQAQAEYGGLGLVIVDYLQLMRADSRIENRVQQVGEMSRGLKILARELNVPVIALSQLSRGVESRTDKRPMLSDLRECVTGDTLVVLADGRRVPISDLVGQTPDVVAVDATDRLVTTRSEKIWSVGSRPVFTVRLASGRAIRATGEHRIRTGAGWRTISELAEGDRIGLARQLPEPSHTIRWSDERLVLLGQLVGDGSYLSGQPLRYTTASEENSAAVAGAAEREFGARVTRHAGRGNWHQLVLAGNGNRWRPAGVNAWLRELGIFNQRSHEKRLPAEVFQLANEQVALLLRHLWATDGCLWSGLRRSNGRVVTRVYFSTASEGLARDVAALLLRLGIVARLGETPSEHGRAVHHVDVSGVTAQRRFLADVGAFGPRVAPAEKLNAALATMPTSTNVDTLPREVWSTVREAMTERGVTQRAMAAMRGTSYGGQAHFAFAPSRSVIAGYATLLDAPALAAAAQSDLFWDRVDTVEPAGEENVYDLTVPGPACWLADGIVSHNSGQIEQDADLVMFIYRDEYYFPETTDRPGEAELIIAKHRNGGLGDVPLTFQNEYPRFLGLQRAA
jgi:replicative DNA helicase